MSWRDQVKRALGPAWTTRLRVLSRGGSLPRWGNLRRTQPFSSQFGFDRGAPIDRYYLERFLDENAALIAGDVLEIQGSGYTRRFGSRLKRVESIDINPAAHATYTCDLARSEATVPSDRFDCFLLPNTLSVLQDIEGCLRQALRVVRPGGAILAVGAGFVPLNSANGQGDYWRLTAEGWRQLTSRAWPRCEVQIESHGNCLAAVAALYGIAVEELSPEELDAHDPRYPVMTAIRCIKAGPA